MVNFNIRNGDIDYLKKADEFLKYYNTPNLTVKEILKELNITIKQYNSLRKYCIDFKGLEPKRRRVKKIKRRIAKHYTKNQSGNFTVQKTVNGKKTNFGSYKTEGIAEAIVKELEKVDWDKNELPRILEKGGVSLARYYYRTPAGTFQVRKTVNGKVIVYGVYKTPEIAEAVVRELIKVNWNKKKLKGILEEVLG